jgi:hypothetical protein
MTLLDVALSHYDRQQAITRATQDAVRRLWLGLDPLDLDGSWLSVADRMLVTVAAAQQFAAQQADTYLDEALDEQDADTDADAQVAPAAFAGVASDGRSLDALLYSAVIAVKLARRLRLPPLQAVARGEATLLRIAGTQVQDAGRAAVAAGMVARPRVTGWTRMLSGRACGRCAILAGRVYRYSEGFKRHPGCSCQHIPAAEDAPDDIRTDPRAYFDGLPRAEQERLFGKKATEQILSGQNMNRVVNASRSTATAGARPRGPARVTAEQIVTGTPDRGDAVASLRRAGFLT